VHDQIHAGRTPERTTGEAVGAAGSDNGQELVMHRFSKVFWLELALAVLNAFFAGLTLISREWIEVLFGVDPDGGSGALEVAIVICLIAAAVVMVALARMEWRRINAARKFSEP
jgi:hypothetical protein